MTPLEQLRSNKPDLYGIAESQLTDMLWDQLGKDKYADESIFREYLTTDTGLFDKSRLKTITPTIESEQQVLPEEKVDEEVSPFRQKEYWVDVLQNIAQQAVTTTGLTMQGMSGLKAFSELPEEKQKLVFAEDTALYKTFKKLGLLNEDDKLDLSWLPSEDREIGYLREKSTEILANPDSYTDDRIEWAKNTQQFLQDREEARVDIKDRPLYKAGEKVQEWGKEAIPIDREKWSQNYLANLLLDTTGVIGSTLPFIATGMVGSSIRVGAVTLALPATMSVGAGEAVERAYDYQEQDGVRNEDDIAIAAILGTVPGAVDYMPVGILLNRFNHYRPEGKKFIRRFLEAAVSQGLWEGTTEEVQQFLQNMIAQDYNANQKLSENLGKQFLPAFLGGGIMGGIGMSGKTTPTDPKDEIKEKVIDKEIGDKPTEEQKEKADEGSPDEVKKDFSPDGFPPVGATNIDVNEAGVDIGNGKIISYDRDPEDDSMHVKMEMEDGTIIDRPVDEIDMVWNDRPDVDLPEGAPLTKAQQEQYDAAEPGTIVTITNEDGQVVQYMEKPAVAEEEVIPDEEITEEQAAQRDNHQQADSSFWTTLYTIQQKLGDESAERYFNEAIKKMKFPPVDRETGERQTWEDVKDDLRKNPDKYAGYGGTTVANQEWLNMPVGNARSFFKAHKWIHTQAGEEMLPIPETDEEFFQQQEEKRKPKEEVASVEEEVTPVEEVKEPKTKVLTDNIKKLGDWNNVFEANKENEDAVNQLTNFNLEDLIEYENNVTVLNQAKNKLYKTKALGDNTVAKSNIQLVQNRIAELEGRPVEEVTPIVKPVEEKKPKEFIDEILSSKETEEKVEEKVEDKTTGAEELAGMNNEQIGSLIDDIVSEVEVEEKAPVEKKVVEEKVKEIVEEAKPTQQISAKYLKSKEPIKLKSQKARGEELASVFLDAVPLNKNAIIEELKSIGIDKVLNLKQIQDNINNIKKQALDLNIINDINISNEELFAEIILKNNAESIKANKRRVEEAEKIGITKEELKKESFATLAKLADNNYVKNIQSDQGITAFLVRFFNNAKALSLGYKRGSGERLANDFEMLLYHVPFIDTKNYQEVLAVQNLRANYKLKNNKQIFNDLVNKKITASDIVKQVEAPSEIKVEGYTKPFNNIGQWNKSAISKSDIVHDKTPTGKPKGNVTNRKNAYETLLDLINTDISVLINKENNVGLLNVTKGVLEKNAYINYSETGLSQYFIGSEGITPKNVKSNLESVNDRIAEIKGEKKPVAEEKPKVEFVPLKNAKPEEYFDLFETDPKKYDKNIPEMFTINYNKNESVREESYTDLILIPVDDALKLINTPKAESLVEGRVDSIKKDIVSGRKITKLTTALYMGIESEHLKKAGGNLPNIIEPDSSGSMIRGGSEGRHIVHAFKELGIDKVPFVLTADGKPGEFKFRHKNNWRPNYVIVNETQPTFPDKKVSTKNWIYYSDLVEEKPKVELFKEKEVVSEKGGIWRRKGLYYVNSDYKNWRVHKVGFTPLNPWQFDYLTPEGNWQFIGTYSKVGISQGWIERFALAFEQDPSKFLGSRMGTFQNKSGEGTKEREFTFAFNTKWTKDLFEKLNPKLNKELGDQFLPSGNKIGEYYIYITPRKYEERPELDIATRDFYKRLYKEDWVQGTNIKGEYDIIFTKEKPKVETPKPIFSLSGTKPATTPDNLTTIDYKTEIVPLSQLITSDNKNKFPQVLQPRERDSKPSEMQVELIAKNPKADWLGEENRTDQGAPIVGPDNVVESGNGRVMGLRLSSKQFPTEFQKYLQDIAVDIGTDTVEQKKIADTLEKKFNEGDPSIVVRRRVTSFSEQERIKFTQDSNSSSLLTKSPAEQARIDASRMPEGLIDLYEGGLVALEKNREFVRGFYNIIPKNEQREILDDAGDLTQNGVRRIENSLIIRAFGDISLFNRIAESTTPEVKALSESFLMAAPRWIKLRESVESGVIPKEFDLTYHVIDAVNQIRQARKKNMPFYSFLNQYSFLDTGEIHPYTKLLSTVFYRGKDYKNLETADNISKVLSQYADSSRKFDDLFLNEQTPAQILERSILNVKKEILPITEEELNGYRTKAEQVSPTRPESDAVFLGEKGERNIDFGNVRETGDSLRAGVPDVAERPSPELSREEQERLGESSERITESGTGPINRLAREQESRESGRRPDNAQPEQLDEFTSGAERGKVSDTSESRQQSERDLQYDQLARVASSKLSQVLDKVTIRTKEGSRKLTPIEKENVIDALTLSRDSYVEKFTDEGLGGIVDIKGRVNFTVPDFVKNFELTVEELSLPPELAKVRDNIVKDFALPYGVEEFDRSEKIKVSNWINIFDQRLPEDNNFTREYLNSNIVNTAINNKFGNLPNPRKYFLQKSNDSLKNLIKALKEISEEYKRKPPVPLSADVSPDVKNKDYKKAKPFFEKSWADAKDAGLGINEWLRQIIADLKKAFGKVKEHLNIALSHLKRFAQSLRQGSLTNTTKEGEQSKYQLKHTPISKAKKMETFTPIDLDGHLKKGMNDLRKRRGDIDRFVTTELDYKDENEMVNNLGAEQVEAVALAIDQLDSGKGFVLGDQTGVGKGRVVAAMLRWSKLRGKNAVFVTQKPALYADMIRDLNDIGENIQDIKILPTNNGLNIDVSDVPTFGEIVTPSKKEHEQELDRLTKLGNMEEYDYVFTTYDQMNRIGGKIDTRHQFLETIAENSIFILDESHTGGGQGIGKFSSVPFDSVGMTRADFLRDLLRRSQGAMYSSATWAKNPKVMDLYLNTDIQDSIPDAEEFIDTMIKGGLPLQSVVSNMLAETGQYRRVEKSFQGIRFNTVEINIDKKGLTETANNLSSVYQDLVSLDRKISAITRALINIDPVLQEARKKGAKVQITPSNFKSQMHYISGQLMTAMKIKEVGEMAIKEHKAGRKPMIVLSRTMEAFLTQYAAENNLKSGDVINLTYNDLLLKYLKRLKQFKVKIEKQKVASIGTHQAKIVNREPVFILNNSSIENIAESLGYGDIIGEFNALEQKIKSLDFKDLSVKPIDDLIVTLENAGIKVRELTGRGMTITKDNKLKSRANSPSVIRNGVNEFNAGEVNALVMNRTAGTGLSMHSSESFADQKQRHMIVLEAEPNVTDFVQILGRINRTGQVIVPQYSLFNTSHPAEKRIAAMLERKMASLNASTSGSIKNDYSVKGIVDFMNAAGDKAVREFLQSNASMRSLFTNSDKELEEITGIADAVARGLLIMDPATANKFYDFVLKRYTEIKEEETGLGINKNNIIIMPDTQAVTTEQQELHDGLSDGSPFQKPVYLDNITMKKVVKPYTVAQLRKKIEDVLEGKNIQQFSANEIAETRKVFEEAINEVKTKFQTETEDIVDPKKKTEKEHRSAKEIKRLETLWTAIESHIAKYPIGSTIQIRVGKEEESPVYDGMVINRKRDTSKNPATSGAIQITLALANGETQQVTVALSRFIKNDGTSGESILRSVESSKVQELFTSGQKETTEERHLITGNLLLGSSLIKGGNFVNIQKRVGDTAEFDQVIGILMPKTFDVKKAIENMPFKFGSEEEVYQYFVEAGKNAKVKNYRGDIEIFAAPSLPNVAFIRVKKSAKLILENEAITNRLQNGWKKMTGEFSHAGRISLVENAPNKSSLYDVLQHMHELGIKFQTVTNREAAQSAKDNVRPNNAGEGGSVGAMKTPKDLIDSIKDETNVSRNSLFKRIRNSMTSMAQSVNERYSARKNPRVGETRQFNSRTNEHADNIIMPEVNDSINIKTGIFPAITTGMLKKILPPFVVAKRFADKTIFDFVRKAIAAQAMIRKVGYRLEDDFLSIKRKYKKADFNKVVDILWSGDSAGRIFTAKELKEGFTFTKEEKAELKKQGHSAKEINRAEKESKFTDDEVAMYLEMRKLFEKIGRYIDKHNFNMVPFIRRMKTLRKKQMESQVNPEFLNDLRTLFARKFLLERQFRNNIGNPELLRQELQSIDEQILSIPLIKYSDAAFEKFNSSVGQYVLEERKLMSISVRKKVGYVPHIFFGSFRLKVLKGIDKESGQEIWEDLIVPETSKDLAKKLKAQGRSEKQIQDIINDLESSKHTLFYNTKDEALKAAQRYVKENPTGTVKIAPVNINYMFDDRTVLNDREYKNIMEGITSSLSEELKPEDVAVVGERAKETMKRRGRRRIPTFSMKRKGIPGYEKNLNQVFKMFAASVSRYRYMDELKYDHVNLMERKGWGEVSEITDPDGRKIAEWLQTYWKDLNNEQQGGEHTVDRLLDEMQKTFAGNPKLWATFAISSPVVALGLGSTLGTAGLAGLGGYLMYKAMKTQKFKSRAVTGQMLSISAHMKLGAFFNISSAFVNLSQLANVYTKHGGTNTTVALRRATAALFRMARRDFETILKNPEKYSTAKVNAARDALMLKKYADVKSEYFYTDENPDIFAERSKLGEFSMMWFQTAETINRSVSFFAGFHESTKAGKNRKQSIEAGKKSIQEQQFSYDNSAKPELLRSTLLRVPLQFKNWMMQQIAFMGGLRGWEWPRFLALYFLLAGALGNTFLALADHILRLFGFSPMQYIKEWSVEMAGKGETEAMVGQMIAHGLPSVVSSTGWGPGINLSSRVGLGDKGLPTELRDFQGPLLSTFLNMYKLSSEGASIGDHIANITPAGKVFKGVEAMAGGMPLESVFTDFPEFSQNFMANWRDEQEATVVDAYRNRNIKIEGFSDGDLLRMMLGFQTTKEAQISDFVGGIKKQNELRSEEMNFVKTKINNAVRKYKNNSDKLGKELQKIIEEAMEDGVNITYQGIKRMIIDAHLSLMDREFKNAPKHQKEWILNNIQNMENLYGSDAIGSYID